MLGFALHCRILVLLVLLFAALATSPGAQALPYSGTLTIQYAPVMEPDVDGAPLLEVSGGGISSDGPDGSFTLSAGDFAGTDSGYGGMGVRPTIEALEISVANEEGSFAAGAGSMSVVGTMTQYFFYAFDPDWGVPIPLDTVGVGGSDPFTGPVASGSISGTITGSEWTTGTVSRSGFLGSLEATGLDARSPDGSGTIVLVTGFEVAFDNVGVITEPIPGIATLTLDFAPEPEPGTAALVALGAVALRSRRRSLC